MIYNPLAPDPNSLSDDDLQEKITQLQKKYLTASRFSSQTLVLQIQQTITMYVDEQQKRAREKLRKQMQQNKDDSKDLGDLINVQ
jgi:hypothetical protein